MSLLGRPDGGGWGEGRVGRKRGKGRRTNLKVTSVEYLSFRSVVSDLWNFVGGGEGGEEPKHDGVGRVADYVAGGRGEVSVVVE